jgi:hypothetical protein
VGRGVIIGFTGCFDRPLAPTKTEININEQTVKRFAVLAAAAGLSTWAIDMAATQVGLPTMQAALGDRVAGCVYSAWASELERLLPEVGDAWHAVVNLRLRVYGEVGSTFLRLVENYAAKLEQMTAA